MMTTERKARLSPPMHGIRRRRRRRQKEKTHTLHALAWALSHKHDERAQHSTAPTGSFFVRLSITTPTKKGTRSVEYSFVSESPTTNQPTTGSGPLEACTCASVRVRALAATDAFGLGQQTVGGGGLPVACMSLSKDGSQL